MNRELVTGLAQLSAEKGLPKEVVGDIIARALKRAYGAEENIDVKVDITTGAFKVYLLKTVVEKVEDPKMQIELKAAQRIKPDAQLGDIVPLEESAAALGRIGAQTAKQVIQQSLREAEREQVFAEYAQRAGLARALLHRPAPQGRRAGGAPHAPRAGDHRQPRAQDAREAPLRARGTGDLPRTGGDRRPRA